MKFRIDLSLRRQKGRWRVFVRSSSRFVVCALCTLRVSLSVFPWTHPASPVPSRRSSASAPKLDRERERARGRSWRSFLLSCAPAAPVYLSADCTASVQLARSLSRLGGNDLLSSRSLPQRGARECDPFLFATQQNSPAWSALSLSSQESHFFYIFTAPSQLLLPRVPIFDFEKKGGRADFTRGGG